MSLRARPWVLAAVLFTLVAGLLVAAPGASAASAPRVSGLSHVSGPSGGRNRITVTGHNFRGVTAVYFGTTRGKSVTVLSSTKLKVTAPAHRAGWLHLRVRTHAGTSKVGAASRYTYVAPPAVSSVSPKVGAAGGGARVTIHGSNFVHVTSVRFGSAAGHVVRVSSSKTLTVTAPGHGTGTVDVHVITAYGTAHATSHDRFTFRVLPQVRSYQYAGTTDPDQSLTATWLPTRTSAPWVVTIHGGSWIHGSEADSRTAANLFYSRGWQVFNLSYRIGPTVTYEQQVADLLKARDWIRAHAAAFHLNPNRGTVYGFSAGGQLAAVLGLAGGFRVVVSLSGVLQPQRVAADAEKVGPDPGPVPAGVANLYVRERTMMGCAYVSVDASDGCGQRWRAFSPEFAITPTAPAFYIVQGEQDTVVPPGTATAFGAVLAAHNVPHQVTLAAGYGHTERDVFDSSAKQTAMLRWVVAHSS